MGKFNNSSDYSTPENVYSHWSNNWEQSFNIYKMNNGDICFRTKQNFQQVTFLVNPEELKNIVASLKKLLSDN
jgi:hypothetical protein